MSLSCHIGIHTWYGCKCIACGKVRAEQHVWKRGVCSRCGGHDTTSSLLGAVRSGAVADARTLLAGGAAVNVSDRHGWTPLHFAADRRLNPDVAMARLLLEHGADLGTKNRFGCTPLHIAAIHGTTDVMALFLRRGADIDAADVEGWTALHAAIRYRQQTAIVSLVENGASLEAKTGRGSTPLEFAVQSGNGDAASFLSRLSNDDYALPVLN